MPRVRFTSQGLLALASALSVVLGRYALAYEDAAAAPLVRPASAPRAASSAATAPTGTAGKSPVASSTYRVEPGDTLSEIAARFGVATDALATLNALADEDFIYAGMLLRVPDTIPAPAARSVAQHRVEPGETLSGIALRYGLSFDALLDANDLDNPDHIRAGGVLVIPSTGGRPPAASGVNRNGRPAPVADVRLTKLLEDTLRPRRGSYSVVVRSLSDGRVAAYNPNASYYPASTSKLAILFEAYRQRDRGTLSFDKMLTLTQRYADHDYGTMSILGLKVGDALSISTAVRHMIVVSDTPTALLVRDALPAESVDATMRALGIDLSLASEEPKATAVDLDRLLQAILFDERLSARSREEMLSLLRREWVRDGILAGLPSGVPVAHKSGNWSNATHDVAVVFGPTGPYTISILSDRAWQWGAIAEVSRVVYRYFASETH